LCYVFVMIMCWELGVGCGEWGVGSGEWGDIHAAGVEYLPRIEREICSLGEDPAAVRRVLEAEEAVLIVLPSGFLVVETEIDRGEPCLFVWMAFCRGAGNVRRFWPFMEEWARATGLSGVRGRSTGGGWGRLGWELVGMVGDEDFIFERGVSHGEQRVE
jgi:hypothetical protein